MNRLVIHIPYKIPTINHIYGQRGFRRYIKKEGKELQDNIKDIVIKVSKNFKHKDEKLKLSIGVVENWYTKQGKIKRKDVDNRIKFLQDCVFKALDIDDKYVWEVCCKKIQSDSEERCFVVIKKIK